LKAWALPGQNVETDYKGKFVKAFTMIAAISKYRGLVDYSIYDGYLNTSLYITFLDIIKAIYRR